ncbi:MAG TPA: alpha/beta hydrolase [Nocardioidaceae bacterium]|nr:alpha/beta hydrolase [Nocardioidaceae bacterium]
MSTRRRKAVGIVAAAAGTIAAGAVAGMFAEKRLVSARRAGPGEEGFGELRSDPVTVIAGDGVALHAEVDEPDEPDPDRATLVFVHGYALNLDCWHFQREHFRGSRRMVFYDQRSHGRSARSSRENATIDQLGHDLVSVLDQLVPEGPVVLVGHSMGGMTIMALADQHPELFGTRVVGVGLVSTTAGDLRTNAAIAPFLPDRLMSQVTPRLVAGLARSPGLVDGVRRAGSDIGFLATARLAFGDAVPASYVEFVDEMLAQTSFEVLAEFFPNFDAFDQFSVMHAFARVPTVVICGDKDRLTSIGLSRKMASLIPGADLVECLGAGHMVILERREQVDEALDRMVEQADAHGASTRAS